MYLTPYSVNAELFIALRDVDYHYILSSNNYGQIPVKKSLKSLARMVTVYFKPPGTSQWVERGVTETVYKNKSPIFLTKLYFQFEIKDAAAMLLRFDVHDIERSERDSDFLGSAETNLETLLNRGSKGLELTIEPQIKHNPFSKDFLEINVEPGKVFLRLETLQNIEQALLLQLGVKRKGGSCFQLAGQRSRQPCYFELHKLNQKNLFGVAHPYSLVHRSEPLIIDGDNDECWSSILIPLAQLNNGDMERVIKIEIFEPNCSTEESKWFTVTTLGKMVNENEMDLPLSKHNGQISERTNMYAALCHIVPQFGPNYFLGKGVKIKRVYAIDFSISNWNFHLHKGILHDTLNPTRSNSRSPYEEALELCIESFLKFPENSPESLLYSFGNKKLEPFVTSFGGRKSPCPPTPSHSSASPRPINPLDEALMTYQKILQKAKEVLDDQVSEIDPTCLSMFKSGATPPSSTLLAPFLNDILELLSIQPKGQTDYFTVMILTDGQIKDLAESKQILAKLASYPVTLIFIGIGFGDLKPLLCLERDCHHPMSDLRDISIIHFRSLSCWESSLRQSGYQTEPKDLFKMEIMNRIGEDMTSYARLYWQKCFG